MIHQTGAERDFESCDERCAERRASTIHSAFAGFAGCFAKKVQILLDFTDIHYYKGKEVLPPVRSLNSGGGFGDRGKEKRFLNIANLAA